MSSFKSPEPNWKSNLKSSESAGSLTCRTFSRRVPSQRRRLTVASINITPQERSSTGKKKQNNVLPTTQSQTHQREKARVTGTNIHTNIINQQGKQQTFTQRPTREICPTVHAKMPLLPGSSKPKVICPFLPSSSLQNEVLRKSRATFTSLPEHLYKGSKLPIPIIQLGRKLPDAPDGALTTATTTSWVRKAEIEKRQKAKAKSKAFTKRDPCKSKIPLLLKDRHPKPVEETIRMDSASMERLSTGDMLRQSSDATPVPLGVYTPLRELTLMNQTMSQLRCVLATLQGTLNTVEHTIKEEMCTGDKVSEDLMLSKCGLKSNFESMGRAFKNVSDTLSQLKILNMKALGLYTKEMLPPRERNPMLPPRGDTFLVSNGPKKPAVKRTPGATMEDSQIDEKSLDVIRITLDISLSKDEDITVEEIRDKIVDTQIDLLDDAVMSPDMTIYEQLLKSEELKSTTIQEVEELVRARQSFNPNQTIVEEIEEIERNPLEIKAHEIVMEVLAEALQEDPTQTISDISSRKIEETGSNMNSLTVPITEKILTKEGNISVFELELSLQQATGILDAIDPCPSVTMASQLYDVLEPGSLKTTIINKSIREYPDLTVREIQEDLQAVQSVLHNAELHPESTKIRQLMNVEYLSENPLVGKILRKETSSNPDRTILSLESEISDAIHSLNENAGPQTKLRQLEMLTEGGESQEDANMKMIKDVCESLRVSVEASENVTDVVMEAIVEASLKEDPVISLAETKDNVIRAQMLIALLSPSLTTKIVDLHLTELLESLFIPRVMNKAVAVRGNMSVSELHQSFEEVKERLCKAAVAPHMIRLFLLLNEPNRLHLSPKCALLKDAILTSSAPLALYWRSYYAGKLTQNRASCFSSDSVKLKVKIIKNAVEIFKGKECNIGFLIKMVKKWKHVLKKVRHDQPAATIPACNWTSLSGLGQSIIEEIACTHPLRRVSGLLTDVTKFIEQLNSVAQIGNTVTTFEPEPYENDPSGLPFQEIAAQIVDVAGSVDRDMPIRQLSKKMEILKGNLEEFVENSTDATVTDVIEEGKILVEVRTGVIEAATSIHPGITAWQMQKCLSEIQNDIENVAIVPDQIAISSLHVEDPVFTEEIILHTKNEIINEAVKQDPDLSLGELNRAISATHKCLLSSKSICYRPNEVLQTPNNFVMKAIHGCVACSGGSIGMVELLEKVGRNLLSTNSIDPDRTVQEEQENRLKEETRDMKEFNPFDIAYLANQYPPMRHAVVANITFKPLALHMLRPFIPDLRKYCTIERVPNETPIDYNGREYTDFDFLGSTIQPYSYYKELEYLSRRPHEENTKILFYEK